MEKFTVNPYEVKGEIDYDKLIKEFGVNKISEEDLKRIQKYTKDLHPYLKNK